MTGPQARGASAHCCVLAGTVAEALLRLTYTRKVFKTSQCKFWNVISGVPVQAPAAQPQREPPRPPQPLALAQPGSCRRLEGGTLRRCTGSQPLIIFCLTAAWCMSCSSQASARSLE